MLIKNIVRYLTGYIFFELKGINTQEFLSDCLKKNIMLSNISFEENKLIAGCTVKDYKEIQKIKTHKIRRRITKKVGIRFKFYRHRKRWGLYTGIVLMLVSLIVLSRFVWHIDVSGNERVSSNVILQTLSECGFREGIYKGGINATEIENKVLDKLYDLSWISLNLDGSTAHVEVKERRPTPTVLKDKKPSNLVASRDGIIVKMEITKGKPIAQVGSGVVKGEMLVSGLYNDKKDNVILEHSSGKVTARVEVNKTFKISRHGTQKISTEKKILYSFVAFNKEFDLSFGGKSNLSKWRSEIKKNNISILGLKLPFEVVEYTFSRDEIKEHYLSSDEAKELIKMEIEHFENDELYEAQILKKHITWVAEEENFSAKVGYIVNMDIASQQYIETE